jgi:hypothetical protein
MAYNGTTFDLTATRLVDPATANLTFTSYTSGDFTFTLSSRIYTTSLTITGAGVNGFTNITCTLPTPQSDDLLGQAVIKAGTTGVTQTGTIALDCTILRYKRQATMEVNGVTKSNGQTIVIGGTTVTIVIDSSTCEGPYAC